MKYILKPRRGTASQWADSERPLEESELGVKFSDDGTVAQILIGGKDGPLSVGLPPVTTADNGMMLIVENGMWVLGYPPNSSGSDAYEDPYIQISITGFTVNAGTDLLECGETIDEVVLSWSLNKEPTSLTLNDETLDVKTTSKTLSEVKVTSKNNVTWKLVAIDERNMKSSVATSVSVANGIYYGVASEPSEYNSEFILGLTKVLKNSRVSPITVNAGEGEYIYYALPKRYGECAFTVGSFTGGFSLVDTIAFTNAHGYTEDYYIYKSDDANRGSITIVVSEYRYNPIQILRFTHGKGSSPIEYRQTIDDVVLSWSLNKAPTSLTLDGESLDVKTTSKTLTNVPVTSDGVTWTLTAKDEKGAESTEEASIEFVNGVYYGTAAEPTNYDSAFILGLANKKLQDAKVSQITVNCGDGKYVYYALPTRLGECSFTFGPFTGGFILAKTINFTNAFGYTEQYRIYRSNQKNLGQITLSVS